MAHQQPQPGYYPHPQPPAKKSNAGKIAIIILWPLSVLASCGIGGAFAGGGNSSTTSAAPEATITVTQPGRTVKETVKETVTAEPEKPKAATSVEDGTWIVGVDIPVGTYRPAENVGSECYWKITRSGTNGDDIIRNDFPGGGRPMLTLRKGQDFYTARCGTWEKTG